MMLTIISFLPQTALAKKDVTDTSSVNDFQYEIDMNGVRIVKYIGIGGDVVVPDQIDGRAVTAIGDYAFSHCTSLKSIILPNTIHSIDGDAFWGCTSLEQITLPEQLQIIAPNAFWECSALTSIDLPDTLASIGYGAFGRCDQLTSITIPKLVTSLDHYTFGSCLNLFKIEIPETMTYMADDAFSQSPSATIFSTKGSYAETYASTHNLPFVSITASCRYHTHVQNIGWQNDSIDGETSGTTGLGLRLEGIEMILDNSGLDLGIEYRTHVQNIGWQNWVSDGAMSGTSGLGLRLEAISIRLTGSDASDYDIYYQVHAQNVGWLDWAKNGENSGTAGYSYRLEGIRIVIVNKGDSPPGSTTQPYIEEITTSYLIDQMRGLWYAYIEPTTHILYFTDDYCIDRTYAASLGQNLGGYFEVLEATENGGTIRINTTHLWKVNSWDYHPSDPMLLTINFDAPEDNKVIIQESGASDAPYDISNTCEWTAAYSLDNELYEFPNIMFGELIETSTEELHNADIEYHLDHSFTDFGF
jgi:uncharacterized protein YjdB